MVVSIKNKLFGFIIFMEIIGVKVLEDFVDNIKNDLDKEYNMLKDGIVYEFISNVIFFL